MKKLLAMSLVVALNSSCGISSFKSLNEEPSGAEPGQDLPATPGNDDVTGQKPPESVLGDIEKDYVVGDALFAGCKDPAKVQKIQQNLNFEKREDCRFGQGDNLPIKDEFVTARESQTIAATLPQDSVVCDINLESVQADLHYDDFLFITLNNDILVASETGFANLFTPVNGLKPWDWLKLRGQSFALTKGAQQGVAYCLNDGNCTMPGHDEIGAFKYNVNLEEIPAMAAKILNEKKMDFTVIATGDNDPADCDHSSFNLNLTVDFAPLP